MAEKPDILVPVASIGNLLEHLQCPLCKGQMMKPITFCEKGHNTCSICREALGKCPTCGSKFSGTRNINLEHLSLWSSFTCPNVQLGCPIMRPSELMPDHLATCVYKMATCPLNKILSIVCPWKGLLKDMISHCKESHNSRFAEGETFKSSSIRDAVNIILFDDELFIYHKRFNEGKLYCAVEKVGISQTLYSATFILDTLSGFDRITFTHIVRGISDDLDVLLQSGKFLKLNDKLLKTFITDGKLPLEVIISKVDSSK
jgi:hypothetical protein